MPTPVSFPPANLSVLDQFGNFAVPWYRALLGMFDRTGGAAGQSQDSVYATSLALAAQKTANTALSTANLAQTEAQSASQMAGEALTASGTNNSTVSDINGRVAVLESQSLRNYQNLSDVSNPVTARTNLGAAPIATPTFTNSIRMNTNGPTWTSGNGAPSSNQPVGSLYSRTDGALGNRLYVSAGGEIWNPVAGV